ncbi:MAG: DUF3040 domain-containing protein [Flaviflexus sp.]|nr:DUF3040 domain-containing protein [Flaviflexus sp.]
MALSEYEQKMLAQLEAQLKDEDPQLAETFTPPRQISLRRLVFGIFAIVAGIAVLVGGVSTRWWWLGVIGFGIMLAGTLYMFSGTGESAPAAQQPRRPKPPRSSFMDKQAELWERRREQGPDR